MLQANSNKNILCIECPKLSHSPNTVCSPWRAQWFSESLTLWFPCAGSNWEQMEPLPVLKHRPAESQEFLAEREWNGFSRLPETQRNPGPERRPRPQGWEVAGWAGIWVPQWLVQCSFPNTVSSLVARRCSDRAETLSAAPRSTPAYLFKIATPPLLPVHHVMENWNHDIPEIWLGYQGHF